MTSRKSIYEAHFILTSYSNMGHVPWNQKPWSLSQLSLLYTREPKIEFLLVSGCQDMNT